MPPCIVGNTGDTLPPVVALRDGLYPTVPIDVIRGGPKRVDVSELYDAEEYVPRVRRVRGKPMFLY